jgi:hypothetical protein
MNVTPLPGAGITASLDLHLRATAQRTRSPAPGDDSDDAVRQARHLATIVAKKVGMLRGMIALLCANELEAPKVPEIFSGDQARTDEIHQVAIEGRAVVAEMREHLDEIPVAQRRRRGIEPLEDGDARSRSS